MKTKNRQGDAKADKSGSDLQNETPQKTEVQALSFRGVLFGINRLMSKWHRSTECVCLPHGEGAAMQRKHCWQPTTTFRRAQCGKLELDHSTYMRVPRMVVEYPKMAHFWIQIE